MYLVKTKARAQERERGAGSLVYWFWVTTHVLKVVLLNPGAVYWMDIWTFFTLICCKHCIVCLKRPKVNKKEAVVGPFFKNVLCRKLKVWALCVKEKEVELEEGN